MIQLHSLLITPKCNKWLNPSVCKMPPWSSTLAALASLKVHFAQMLFIFEKSLRIWGWGKTHFKVRSQCSGTTCCDKIPPSWNSIPEDRWPKHWENRSVQEGWCTTDNHRLRIHSAQRKAADTSTSGEECSCPVPTLKLDTLSPG